MYRYNKPTTTSLKINKQQEGESIETKVQRIVNNKEPIKDGAPRIYTERKDGVNADMNIRTDRWELAVEGRDYITRSHLAKRDSKLGEEAAKNMQAEQMTERKKDGGAEPVQGTDGNQK